MEMTKIRRLPIVVTVYFILSFSPYLNAGMGLFYGRENYKVDPIFVYGTPSDSIFAREYRRFTMREMHRIAILLSSNEDSSAELLPAIPDTEASLNMLKEKDVVLVGTLEDNKWLGQIENDFPIHISGDTVFLGDTCFVDSDLVVHFIMPNPWNREKYLLVSTATSQMAIGDAGFFILRDKDYEIYRKRDAFKILAYGVFDKSNSTWRINPENLTINSIPKIKLSVTETPHIRVYYNTLAESEAHKVANMIEYLYLSLKDEFSITLPPRIYVYLYQKKVRPTAYTTYTDAFNTFWSKFPDKETFLKPERHAILAFAHEMARLSFQPMISDSTKRGPLRFFADDWSHYAPMAVMIPYLRDKLGEDAWPIPHKYWKDWGERKFLNIYRGGEDTYAYLMYVIDKKYGRKLIGNVIDSLTMGGVFRYIDITEFMTALAEATKDTTIIRKVKSAYPTPFEHSLRREWKPFGLSPRLDELFWEEDMVIDSVEGNSPADSAGFKPGDELIEIEGYPLSTEKALAYRQLLSKDEGDTISIVIKRGKSTQKLFLVVRHYKDE